VGVSLLCLGAGSVLSFVFGVGVCISLSILS
jgi:hypothetical protein